MSRADCCCIADGIWPISPVHESRVSGQLGYRLRTICGATWPCALLIILDLHLLVIVTVLVRPLALELARILVHPIVSLPFLSRAVRPCSRRCEPAVRCVLHMDGRRGHKVRVLSPKGGVRLGLRILNVLWGACGRGVRIKGAHMQGALETDGAPLAYRRRPYLRSRAWRPSPPRGR